MKKKLLGIGRNGPPPKNRPNPPPAPPKSQFMRIVNQNDFWHALDLIKRIQKEAETETFWAGYYDFRPSAKEQLEKISRMIKDFKADL